MALQGLLVVDMSHLVAGPTCTKVLRDLGARVIKIEAPARDRLNSGDALRIMPPHLPLPKGTRPGRGAASASSAYFAMLNAGKESVVLELDSRREGAAADRALFEVLLSRADVLVENFRHGVMAGLGYSAESLRQRYPRLVVASISGFGQSGPYAPRKAVDTIVQAMSGFVATTGPPEAATKVGTTVSDSLAGIYAVAGILAGLHKRHAVGDGSRLDLSMLDCSFVFHCREFAHYSASGQEQPRRGNTSAIGYPFDVMQCADGKSFAVEAVRDGPFKIFCKTLGLPDLPKDPRFSTWALRLQHTEALKPLLRDAARRLTRDHILGELLSVQGSASFPCGPVNGMGDLARCPQLAHRNMLGRTPDGKFALLGNPIKIGGVPELPPADSPALGEHTARVRQEYGALPAVVQTRAAPPSPAPPLEGISVIDMTHAVAGPMCTKILKDLGARVIKIESTVLPGDMTRHFHPHVGVPPGGVGGRDDASASSAYFAMLNADKESVMLELDPRKERAAADRKVFEALLSRADVLVENFRPGVMAALGYSAEALRERYPRLVVSSVSGYGQSGPYAKRKAVDTIVQAMSGFVATTGTPDFPVKVGTTISDLLAGVYSAVGALVGLNRRYLTGRGSRVDVAMYDTSVAFHGREFAAWTVSGKEPARTGNVSQMAYPFDVFECAGGQSFAVEAAGRASFAKFCEVLGVPQLPQDPRFQTLPLRLRHSRELRELLMERTRRFRRADLLDRLLAITGPSSFPVGPVNSMADLERCPQLAHRNMLRRTADGKFAILGNPLKFGEVPEAGAPRRSPPLDSASEALRRECALAATAGRAGWLDSPGLAPRPIAWVSTAGPDGAPVAEASPFYNGAGGGGRKKAARATYDRPVVAFSFPSASVTAANIRRTGEAVLNLATWANRAAVYRAMLAPQALAPGETQPAAAVSAPRIACAPVQLECRALVTEELGAFTAFFCEVVHYRLAGWAVSAEGRVEPRWLLPLAHLRGGHFAVCDDLWHMPFPAAQGVRIAGLGEQSHGADQKRQMAGKDRDKLPWVIPLAQPLAEGQPRAQPLADLEFPGGTIPEPLPYNPYKALVMPRCIGWISTRSVGGVDNISPYSFFQMLSDDVVYFGPGGVHADGGAKDARRDAEQSGVFCVNAVTWELRHEMNASSAYCGRNVDEFVIPNETGVPPLRKAECQDVPAPCVAAAPVRLECKYLKTINLPTADPEVAGDAAVLGRVVRVHVAPDSPWATGDWPAVDVPARGGYFNYHRISGPNVFRMAVRDGQVAESGPAVERLGGRSAQGGARARL
eukprot:TRINITY_DN764_c0_g1_i1.p1 TRINITY_DN764_c0_g1~~TRINITY_DN764_c0_g1_i1.p1  ORF type:complete len:1333 (+),score=404.14 TRINITY_DN764_c0_g1_i1:111-4001(+)